MVEYSLFDKIKTVFNLVTKSPLFLVLIFGIILMVIDILYISKKDKKTKIIYTVISLIVIGLFIYSYLDSVLSIFDTVAKNIVAIIYFPTILEYILMLLISIVIITVSIFSKKMNKVIKRINAFVLIINLFLFLLILDQINNNNVDLSNKVSIYSNSVLMMLLELSIAIFVFWVVGLIIYKVIKILSPKKESELPINLDTKPFYEELELPKRIEDLQKPDPKIEYIIIEKENKDHMFTLEEYKQMRELLSTIQDNKKEEEPLL